MAPLLSIAIPAYNRPLWLERALTSVLSPDPEVWADLEVVVTDDSTTEDCAQVCRSALQAWPGLGHYIANPHQLGMTGNWNKAIQSASGRYVLVLHDDDFLLTGGVKTIIKTLKGLTSPHRVLQFGVQIVNDQSNLLRDQTPKQTEWLEPATAVYNLLKYSSYIRFPGMVVDRSLFETLGYFDAAFAGTADIDMWLRLLSQEGLFRVGVTTAAYTVHSGALTMDMFTPETIHSLDQIFAKARDAQLLSAPKLEEAKSDFFHQFILAGTFRFLRRNNYKAARQTMGLFRMSESSTLKPSPKWLVLRTAFTWVCNLLSVVS